MTTLTHRDVTNFVAANLVRGVSRLALVDALRTAFAMTIGEAVYAVRWTNGVHLYTVDTIDNRINDITDYTAEQIRFLSNLGVKVYTSRHDAEAVVAAAWLREHAH